MTLPFELHDWSETLAFDQIMDTLFIIGQFMNNKKHPMFTPKDLQLVKNWFTKNDLGKFLRAKDLAIETQEAEFEREMYAREIIATPYRRPSSH